MKTLDNFKEACTTHNLNVGIIGLGYVGLPLVIEFAKKGFLVQGFDLDDEKIKNLESGKSYIKHIAADIIKEFISDNERASCSSDIADLKNCDAILICVPTPLTEHQEPDLTYIISTAENLGACLIKGQLIILESTTFPGTTEEILGPILEKSSGLKAGSDFFLAYSPEREDPNNANYSTQTIPKVVGGYNPESLQRAIALYDEVIVETVPVSSCKVAEATKLMENIFRCINIALVNELKVVFSKMGIDVWEVINAAKTKPFGFMPFYPGPGLGGHCIPIDPFYLTWKAKEFDTATEFIELAGKINTRMPDFVIDQTILALNKHRTAVNGSRILLVGLAYKKNVDDTRESPSFVLWEKLEELGASVDYLDIHCPSVPATREYPQYEGIKSRDLNKLEKYDAALIATDHDGMDYDKISKAATVVIDTRNAAAGIPNQWKA